MDERIEPLIGVEIPLAGDARVVGRPAVGKAVAPAAEDLPCVDQISIRHRAISELKIDQISVAGQQQAGLQELHVKLSA
jgi:hypothetical protein